MNYTPIFPDSPNAPYARITGTTTDRTGATPANMVDLFTAGTDGAKVTQIGCKVEGTSVASQLLIFITDASGSNPRLFDEIAISAVTASNTVASFRGFNSYSDLQLKGGQKILVGVTAISANVIAWASTGDY
jgi:hypothetical protein